jgi:Zn-dependent protease
MDFGLTPELLRTGLIFYFLLFAVLVLRAFAQAWLADRMGDPTPRNEGRVTLYPPPHVDLLGTVVLPLICIFYFQPRLAEINFFLAWTKPVPSNPSYFKHPRRGELFTQFAGFGMCVLLCLVAAVIGGISFRMTGDLRLAQIFASLILICAMLMVLDLLPIPPLPGGVLLRHWGIISEEAFWNIARWSGLFIIIMFNLRPVRIVIGTLVQLVASPFIALLETIAR